MKSIENFITGEKRFRKNIKSLISFLPDHYRKSYETYPLSLINYSSYLSNLFQKNFLSSTSSSLKVPSTDGTFSFPRRTKEISDSNSQQKIFWYWNVGDTPSRLREGLVKLFQRYQSQVFLYLFFSPSSFNYSLASKSDFYAIRKNNYFMTTREFVKTKQIMLKRREVLPQTSSFLSKKEEALFLVLWRFRFGFLGLEEISSYLYGNRLRRSIRSSEVLLWTLKNKLEKLYFETKPIEHYRYLGYKLREGVVKKIQSDSDRIAPFVSNTPKAIKVIKRGNI